MGDNDHELDRIAAAVFDPANILGHILSQPGTEGFQVITGLALVALAPVLADLDADDIAALGVRIADRAQGLVDLSAITTVEQAGAAMVVLAGRVKLVGQFTDQMDEL